MKFIGGDANQIWRRFQKEDKPMQLARNKLFKDQKIQFREGDLVKIVDPQVFTDKLHLGKILKLHYSENNIARSVENKTKWESVNDPF